MLRRHYGELVIILPRNNDTSYFEKIDPVN